MHRVSVVALLVLCPFLVEGCRSATGRSFGQQVDDKVISSQIKTKLMTSQPGGLFSTGVGTRFGVVHLTGNVDTAEQRAQAENIAAETAGVKAIVNDIIVGSTVPARPKTTQTASPPAGDTASSALALSGEIMAIDRGSGDVTVKTPQGDVVVRLPAASLQSLATGQRVSIKTVSAR